MGFGGHAGAARPHDERVGERFGKILEQFFHDLGRLDPPFLAGPRTIGAIDVGGTGDAQHGIVRIVERAFGKAGRVGGDERKIAGVGQIDQRFFGSFFLRIVAAGDFDVEALGEEFLKPVEIGFCRGLLLACKQSHQRALTGGGQADQAIGVAHKVCQHDMRIEFQRAIQMRAADEMAEIVVSSGILRIKRQPVNRRGRGAETGGGPFPFWPGDGKHRADDRLHAHILARLGIGDTAVKAVAVGDGCGGKSTFGRRLGDGLRIDRAIQHRVGREDAERDEGGVGHGSQSRKKAAHLREARPFCVNLIDSFRAASQYLSQCSPACPSARNAAPPCHRGRSGIW